jgi:glycosyltransferase involved in cell wall biosynthesis
MKLLVFAHTPPPHHGQSYMVQLMLQGFGGDRRKRDASATPRTDTHGMTCYHVNARVSKELEDIGDFRLSKLFLLIWYCLQAVWCRFRYGVTTMYYIPAPGKHSALYRDWLVMFLCRPFYKKIILHWHAAGLGKWLETNVQLRARSFTYRRMKDVDLSVVLSDYNRADAEKLFPKRIRVVSNGIPDPCPGFEKEILPRRQARFAARQKLAAGGCLTAADLEDTDGDPHRFKILYLAHCTREKGLFDTIKGVVWANQRLAEAKSPFSLELMVAGNFINAEERSEFDRILATPEVRQNIQYLGFVSSTQKMDALRQADLFCFPTYYKNENQPVNLIEAMAFGLPILTTRWRSIPELLPRGYRCLVDICSPGQIASALLASLTNEAAGSFREIFVNNFSLEQYLTDLARAFHDVESANHGAQAQAAAPSLTLSPRHTASNPPQTS